MQSTLFDGATDEELPDRLHSLGEMIRQKVRQLERATATLKREIINRGDGR